jgi:hypothetical protein
MTHKFEIYNHAQYENRSKVPPKIKEKWLEALRSGNYNQIQERLSSPEGYCCLGVLCEVLEIPKSVSPVIQYEGSQSTLPYSVTKKTDLTKYGDFNGFTINEKYTLADLNDSGASFELIAHIIETYF